MTKKLTSLPSTRHQQFYLTTTQSTPQLFSLKSQINQIIVTLKNALTIRIKLEKRDIEQVYKKSTNLLDQIYKVNSLDDLWSNLDFDKDNKLIQKQQILFLNKILTWITAKKFQYADSKSYFQFTEMKALVEWFQALIIEYQIELRHRIKQKGIIEAEIIAKNLESKFKNYEQTILAEEYQKSKQQKQQKNRKDNQQRKKLDIQLEEYIPKNMHKYKPSLTLSKTKDTVLLAKLAPYRNQKKVEYQCKYLQNTINNQIQSEKSRQLEQIEKFKQIQRTKLMKKQKLHSQTLEIKLQKKIDKTICQLEQQKTRLDNSQRIKIYQYQQRTNKKSNQKINWIRNSFNAYNQREQTKKVRQIVRQHHNATQFQNDITKLYRNSQNIQHKYLTLNVQSKIYKDKSTQKKEKSVNRYQRHLGKKLKRDQQYINRQEQQINNTLVDRKCSLVNLYDQNLELI